MVSNMDIYVDMFDNIVKFTILDNGANSYFCTYDNNYYHLLKDDINHYYQKHFLNNLNIKHLPSINYIGKGTIIDNYGYFDSGNRLRIYSTKQYHEVRLKNNMIIINDLVDVITDSKYNNLDTFLYELIKNGYYKKHPDIYKAIRVIYGKYKQFYKKEMDDKNTIFNHLVNRKPEFLDVDISTSYSNNILEDDDGNLILNDIIY